MNHALAASPLDAAPNPAAEEMRRRVAGTNINEKTLLATDYLNHFNEIVMILDLVPDMPEMLDDAKAWQPLTYADHFRQSTFADRDLAIEAYDHVPRSTRVVFEGVVGSIDELVERGIRHLDEIVAAGDEARLRDAVADVSRRLQLMLDKASAIINGDAGTLDQAHIDELLEV